MKLVLVVIGDGRPRLLHATVRSVTEHVTHPITARIMEDDSGELDYSIYLDDEYPDFAMVHGGRRGMAGAVQAGWDAALERDPDYVLWVEEDHQLIRDLPVSQASVTLGNHPELAQMVFSREPCDPSEGDDQLAAICDRAAHWGERADYTWHDYIFSMVPCLIPRRVLELGWPAGPIGIGNEAGMTTRCLEQGLMFANWGHRGDPPYVRHIGYAARTPGWRL